MAGTGAAVPSDAILDLKENAKGLDQMVNSVGSTFFGRDLPGFPDGRELLTIKGMNEAATTGNPAIEAAQDALDYKNEAQTYAEAALTAGWIYATVADGEAARVDGDYFWVVSSKDSEVLELWLMGATTSTDTGKRLNRGVDSVQLENIGKNQNFVDSTDLAVINATLDSVVNNEATFTTTADYGQINQPYTAVSGRKYYYALKVKSSEEMSFIDVTTQTGGTGQITSRNHSGSGEYEYLDVLFEAVPADFLRFRFVERYSGATVVVKQFVLIDLTALFGAGNEPTITEFRAILSSVTDGSMFFINNNVDKYIPASVGVLKNKPYYVHLEGDTLTVIQKYNKDLDIRFVWTRFYPNFVFNLRETYFIQNTSESVTADFRGGNLLDEYFTDTLGPYRVEALNNINGDDVPSTDFTGGSHGYNNNFTVDPSNTPTARLDKLAFYIKNQELDFFSGYIDSVEARWTNFVQASNTKKADGSGREVLREDYRLLFEDGKAQVNNFIEFLEPVNVVQYYGLQASDVGLYRGKVFFHTSDNKKLNPTLTAVNSGSIECDKITLSRDANYFDLSLDVTTGMGKDKQLSTVTYNAFYTTSPKCYFYLIDNIQYAANDIVTFAGSYRYYNDSTKLP